MLFEAAVADSCGGESFLGLEMVDVLLANGAVLGEVFLSDFPVAFDLPLFLGENVALKGKVVDLGRNPRAFHKIALVSFKPLLGGRMPRSDQILLAEPIMDPDCRLFACIFFHYPLQKNRGDFM